MRVRLPLGRSLFFLAVLASSLVALLPLRLAMDWMGIGERGFSARGAQGSVWLGSFNEARLGAVPLGDMQAQLRTLPLLLGRARVDVRSDPLKGSATVSRHGFGLDDWEGKLDTAALFAPLPVRSLDLSDVTARFASGVCVEAEGRVEAAVTGEIAGLTLPGGLSGNARCEGGALLLPLASQSGMESLELRVAGDGRYRLRLAVRPANPALQARLLAAGFAAEAGGVYAISSAGEF